MDYDAKGKSCQERFGFGSVRPHINAARWHWALCIRFNTVFNFHKIILDNRR